MATFLDDITIYNAKAAAAIALAVSEGNTPKANLMSSLKTTANDTTLSNAVRLEALTALINVGNLLDIPLPPYFPVAVTYADNVTYTGLHDNLTGLQGGAPGEYYHLTLAERSDILGKVSPSDLQFANLTDSPYDNALLSSALTGKQDVLSGLGFVKINGTSITYDNSTYLTAVSGPAGGDLSGTYPNPTIASSVVMSKQMFGWNSSYPTGTGAISSSDSLLIAIQKLNASVNNIVTNPSGVSSVSLSMLPNTIFQSSTLPASGAVTLSATLLSQTANTFLAAPDGSNGVPLFRTISTSDIPALSPDPSGTYGGGSPLQIPVITVDAQGRVTSVSTTTASGSGTVTSVNVDPPSYFSVGSPVTAAGDIIMAWSNTISPNTILAGPASGVSTSAPTFRALVAADMPLDIPQDNISGLSDALANKLDNILNDGEIWIGNAATAPIPNSLTGDVLMTREGVVTIQPNVVDFSKMQEITGADTSVSPNIPGNILGRWAAGVGDIQEIVLSGDFVLPYDTGILSLAAPVAPVLDAKGGLITFSQSIGQQVQLPAVYEGNLLLTDSAIDVGLKWVTAQGDIEVNAALDGTFDITEGAVTLEKMADLPVDTIIGNNAALGVPKALSVTEVTAMLDVFDFASTTKGLVPGSNGVGATYFLNANGGWTVPAGGGGSGTVTSVSVVSANGFAGTVATATTTPAITLSTTVTGLLKGNGTAISAATSGTDYAPATSGTSILYGNGAGGFSSATIGTGLSFSTGTLSNTGVTSVGLTMPSAFSVSIPTITTSGTFAVTGAGTVSQYVRGDGTLGIFPSIGGGGGGSVYYMNGGVTASPSTIGGVAMYQLSKSPITSGASVDFTANANGATIASFLTDTGDPNQTSIPAGIWVFECYLSAAGGGSAHPTVQAVVEKWDGTTLSVIATGVAEEITNGATKDLYQFAATIPTGTTISATDRIVVQIKVVGAASKTITLYTQDSNVSSVTTTFANGIASLNGLTAATQLFANGSTGTAPAFVSSTATHTLNIPLASASSVTAGLISKAEYDTFNGKLANVLTTTGDIIYSSIGTTAARLGIGTTGQVLSVVGGIPAWSDAGIGDVVSNTTSTTTGNFAVFADGLGKTIGQSAGASLSAAGAAVFNASLALGVAGPAGTTGQLIFRNGTTGATTTFQSSLSQSANINYTWPQAAGTIGQILSTDASGNLSWTSAGAGDMTLAGVQTVTGAKTFGAAGNVGKLILAGSTSGTTILNAAAVAGSTTVTLPASTSTLAALGLAQSFTALQTFTAGLTVSTGAVTLSTAGSPTIAQLVFSGTTNNWINFGTTGTAAPANGTNRPAGVKFVAYASATSILTDFAIGMASTTEMYLGSSGAAGTEVSMYFGPNKLAAFHTNGLAISRVSGGGVAANIGQILINGGATTTTGQGSGLSLINFHTSASAAPSNANTRTNGTRIILQPNISVSSTDAAIGYNDAEKETWITGAQTTSTEGKISFYSSTTSILPRVGYFGATGLVLEQAGTGTGNTGNLMIPNAGWINYGTTGSSAPTNGNLRPGGVKIVLRSNVAGGANYADYAIGVDAANYETWITGGVSGSVSSGLIGFWVGNGSAFKRTVWVAQNQLNLAVSTVMLINGTQVVGPRDTGYAPFTGATNKATSYATSTVTLIQLAERVAALQASLTAHGLIGA